MTLRTIPVALTLLLFGEPALSDPLDFVNLSALAETAPAWTARPGIGEWAEIEGGLRLWRTEEGALFLCDRGNPAIGSAMLDLIEAELNIASCPNRQGTPLAAHIAGLRAQLVARYAERLDLSPDVVSERMARATAVLAEGVGGPVCARNGTFLAHFSTPEFAQRLERAMAPDHLPAVTCPEPFE